MIVFFVVHCTQFDSAHSLTLDWAWFCLGFISVPGLILYWVCLDTGCDCIEGLILYWVWFCIVVDSALGFILCLVSFVTCLDSVNIVVLNSVWFGIKFIWCSVWFGTLWDCTICLIIHSICIYMQLYDVLCMILYSLLITLYYIHISWRIN